MIETNFETKQDDRRESPRVSLRRIVALTEAGAIEGSGDLGVGGVGFRSAPLSLEAKTVDVEFELPGEERTIRARGEIIERSSTAEALSLRLRFIQLPFDIERAIARFVDGNMLALKPEPFGVR